MGNIICSVTPEEIPLTISTPGQDPIIIPQVERYRNMTKHILVDKCWTLDLLIVIRYRKNGQILSFYYHRTNVANGGAMTAIYCIDCHRVTEWKGHYWTDYTKGWGHRVACSVIVPDYDRDPYLKSEIYVLDPESAAYCKSYRITQCSCYPNTYGPFITSFIQKLQLGDFPSCSKIKEIISEGLPLAMFEELYELVCSTKYQSAKKIANIKQCHINVFSTLTVHKIFLCNDHVFVININNYCEKIINSNDQYTCKVTVSNLTKEERQNIMDCLKSKLRGNLIASFTVDNNIMLANVTGLCKEYYPKG